MELILKRDRFINPMKGDVTGQKQKHTLIRFLMRVLFWHEGALPTYKLWRQISLELQSINNSFFQIICVIEFSIVLI